ncbi:MAG TPA: hypothetical protein VG756_25695 [Pseudonocardiaceae bacterium]|jgi:hypothetical protein|nr:hypothetical protein [Pseudonocardiaceae bacterium]
MRVIAGVPLVVAGLLGLAALAGCADNQPGDVNNGPGYTDNIADLKVKLPALDSDPCRGKQVTTLYPDCGRYVTEVANTLGAIKGNLAGQSRAIGALQADVSKYQGMGCDTITGTPTASQQSGCPVALTGIGTELDILNKALTSIPTSN